MGQSYGQRLRLRLFLEGIEVPIIAANIRSAPNSPTACSIQIPPLAEGTRFLPRTLVHVFFLDLYEQESPLVRKIEVGTPDKRSPTAHEKSLGAKDTHSTDPTEGVQSQTQGLKDLDNSRYKLLFGGEVVGIQWTKNSAQRSLVLQCMDWSNYWDYAYQWGNTGIFGPGIKSVFSGGASNLFTDFLSSKGSVITHIVSSGRCNSFPKLKGLAAGIIRLIEAVGGSYYPRPPTDEETATVKKFAGQNIFFSIAELRLHITHMLAAYEDDPTSAKILKRQGYAGLFNRVLGNLGSQVSIRKSINALTGVIFHETYGQPCPHYKAGLGGSVSGRIRVKLKDDPKLASLVYAGDQALQGLRDVKQTISSFEALSVAGRAATNDPKVTQAARLQQLKRLVDQAMVTARANRAPDQASSLLSKASRAISSSITSLQRWRPDAPSAVKVSLTAKLDQAIAELSTLSSLTILKTKPSQAQPARLNQHILRPDIWFGAPPRCNVLFPEDYDNVSYSRDFLAEPTRLLLKTNDEFFGEDFLFDKFYFAPQAGSLKADKARLNSMLKNDLLEHELFTGILPVFEKMGEFNVFAARSGTQKDTSKVSFAQRSANFLYFKHRFAARQMQVSGRFNPYIAVGFPGLVIDKYADQQTILIYNDLLQKENERRSGKGAKDLSPSRILGTNFLANFTEVSHHVSQVEGRARTEINCSYARQPDESVEFLGSITEKTVRKRQEKDALRATDVASLNAPRLGSIGPLGGKITNVTDVTEQYARQSGSSKPLPVFGRTRRDEGGQLRAPRVQVGIPTSAAAISSTDVADLTGGLNTPVVFRAYRVSEEVPRFKRESAELPAEEYIRPGWYGDVWRSENIGKVYEDFFGIGAITDPQQVRDSSIGSGPVQNEEIANASIEASQAQTADDPRRFAPALTALDQGASIQQAVDFLLLTYSYARLSGADVDQFARSYTWRPIATMVDMLGTSDLKFSPNGETVESGFEGFHSRAFGPFDNLFGLTGPDIEDILGIKRGSTAAQKADTRKRKYEAVQAYVSSLLFSRGLLG